MALDRVNWRVKTRRAGVALTVAALPFAYQGGSAVQAQSIMRSPNLNIQSRIPTINPSVPRIDPNIAGRAVTGIARTPNLRTYPACSYAYRNSDGECSNKPVLSTDGGGTGGSGRGRGPSRRRGRGLGGRYADGRTGGATRPRASAIAGVSTFGRYHRPVPHHRPPHCGDSEPPIRRGCQRSLGAAEFPLLPAGAEGGAD